MKNDDFLTVICYGTVRGGRKVRFVFIGRANCALRTGHALPFAVENAHTILLRTRYTSMTHSNCSAGDKKSVRNDFVGTAFKIHEVKNKNDVFPSEWVTRTAGAYG